MSVDQDLSGDQVKVVQYSIVSVVAGIADNARVVVQPKTIAFSDDMTAEDFTAWVIAENCPSFDDRTAGPSPELYDPDCYPPAQLAKCWNKKYLRVAFQVMGRFNAADIDYEEAQVAVLADIARTLKQHNPPSAPPARGKD